MARKPTTMFPDLPAWVTVAEVAQACRVHHRTVRRWIDSGDLRAYRVGTGRGSLLIARDDLDGLVSPVRV